MVVPFDPPFEPVLFMKLIIPSISRLVILFWYFYRYLKVRLFTLFITYPEFMDFPHMLIQFLKRFEFRSAFSAIIICIFGRRHVYHLRRYVIYLFQLVPEQRIICSINCLHFSLVGVWGFSNSLDTGIIIPFYDCNQIHIKTCYLCCNIATVKIWTSMIFVVISSSSLLVV